MIDPAFTAAMAQAAKGRQFELGPGESGSFAIRLRDGVAVREARLTPAQCTAEAINAKIAELATGLDQDDAAAAKANATVVVAKQDPPSDPPKSPPSNPPQAPVEQEKK